MPITSQMPITQPGSKRRTIKAEAMAFLSHALAGGAVPATEVGRMAREHNLTSKPLRSAREALGITIVRHGFGPGSVSLWSLPGGHTDAQPISSAEGPPKTTKDGYEIVGLASDSPCDYCDERAGPPGPQSGPVYLVRNPFAADLIMPLHEDCAGYWFDWLSDIPKEICDRMLNGARARMRNRVKGEGGHGQV